MFTLENIKKSGRRVSAGCDQEGYHSIYDEPKPGAKYIGKVRLDKSKMFYVGYPAEGETRVKSIEELNGLVEHFRTVCEEKWIDQNALDTAFNRWARTSFALPYLAEKFGWKRPHYMTGNGYDVGATRWGNRLFNIDVVEPRYRANDPDDPYDYAQFVITLTSNTYIESPKFSDYEEAMAWLKRNVWYILFGAGTELLTPILTHKEMTPADFEDVDIQQVDYSSVIPQVRRTSMRDYLIETLEQQLEILKADRDKQD